MAIPPLVLRIVADSKGVDTGVARAQSKVGGFAKTIKRNAGFIAAGLGVAVVAGVTKAVNAAADLGEAQNKVNVIFGKSVGIVNKMGGTAARKIGLAKAEALEAAGAFGAMFDSSGLATKASAEMSVTMTQLAGDMASFNNASPVEMLEKLRSGLAGEAEPLRQFGVFISEARVQQEALRMGLIKVGEEMTDAEKIQARYNLILKDTNKQQGDFARTSDSLPNQLRTLRATFIDLAAKIGEFVVPAISKVLDVVLSVVNWVRDRFIPALGDAVRWVQDHFGPIWEKIKPTVMAVLRAIITGLKTLKEWAVNVADFIGGTFKTVWSKVKGPATTALDAIAGAFGAIRDRIREALQAWNDFLEEIGAEKAGRGFFDFIGDLFGGRNEAELPTGVVGEQHGGWVSRGRPYLVGEAGPELFVPPTSGQVVPNGQFGGTQTINVYVGDEQVERIVVKALDRAAAKA